MNVVVMVYVMSKVANAIVMKVGEIKMIVLYKSVLITVLEEANV